MKVLIAGGGIAGASCAIALRKAGIEVDICEARDQQASDGGAFLTLAPNGLHALQTLGMSPAALGGFETPRMALRLWNDRLLTEFDMKGSKPGFSARTVKRADLYAVLRNEALRRGAKLHYGKRLAAAVRDGEGRVRADFADGATCFADVLVGADGIHSSLRRVLDAKAPSARNLGLLNIGGYARDVAVSSAPGTMQMSFGRRCFFGYVAAPGNEVWWFANPVMRVELQPHEQPPQWWRNYLLELFEDDRFPARELIAATPEFTPVWPTYDFPHVPIWQRDGMVIIGDAAHAASPSSGQGASMAIEDGLTLALCLRDAATGDIALTDYESRRRARVERVVRQGRRNGNGKTPGPFGRVLRDWMLRLIFARHGQAMNDKLDWLYDYRISW